MTLADAAPAAPSLSQAEIRTVIVGAMLALFLAALDQTIVATALPAIAADLGDLELIGWVVTSYLLASTVATPVLGKLADIWGRRTVMRLCLGLFLASSALCALAPDMLTLVIFRALQGIGGGGLITLAQTLVADVVSPRQRGRYSGYFSGVWALAAVLGPTLGGLLTQYVGWPWIFWINLPLGLAALLLLERTMKRLPPMRRAQRIDWFSILLFALATSAFLLALSWGGASHGALTLHLGIAVTVFFAVGALFVLRQRVSPAPLVPLHFLQDRVVRPMLGSIFLIFGSYLAVAVLAPTYLTVVQGVATATTGLLMIPMMISGTISAYWAGRYTTRTGTYKRPPIWFLPISMVALLLLAFFAEVESPLLASVLLFFAGLGIGPIFPIAMVAAQNAVERHDLGAVSGTISFSRSLGGAVATAAGTALVLALLQAWLPSVGDIAGLDELVRRPLLPAERAVVAEAFAVLFVAVAAALALGLLSFLKVEARPLRGER